MNVIILLQNYKVKDAGKVVVYTTTMGVVRETYNRCINVKQILRTHMVKFEERDMYLSSESQTELKDRLNLSAIHVPQLFIDGQYIGVSLIHFFATLTFLYNVVRA